MRLYDVNQKVSALSLKSQEMAREEVEFQKKNALMRPGSVDKDLLEERVRAVLGYRDPGEYTVLGH